MWIRKYDFGDSISYVLRLKTNSINTNDSLTALFGNWWNAGGGLYYYNNDTYSRYGIQFNNGSYKDFVTNSHVSLNTWTTIVGVLEDGNIKLYLNGEKENGQKEFEGNIVVSRNSIKIGGIRQVSGQMAEFANITITDALIFDRALTSEEIANDYATTINPTDTSNMLVRYSFSSNNTVLDLSGNNNNGTIHGGIVNSDGTISTDGIDDFIECGLEQYNFNDSISLISRVKFHSLSGIDPAILANFQNGGVGLYLKNEYISFTTHNGSWIRYISNVKPELDKWYTIVGTYDGEKMKLYINGKEATLKDTTDTFQVLHTGNITLSKQFLLAADPLASPSSAEDFSNITISDALIFDRAVTKEEVVNDYSKTISPSNREDLLLYYHFG